MPGIPAHASRVRVEIDASDVSNLLANHSGQTGATTGWSADTGVTLTAVTDPTRSGETLLGDYTGGKCIKATYDASATITSQVYGPTVTVTPGAWVAYMFSLADSRLVDVANPLQIIAYVEFLDASSTVLGATGPTRQLLSGDDPWQMVALNGGGAPAPAGTASARVKFRFSDNGTTKITRDIYLAKVMMVTGGTFPSVYAVPFSDAADVWQDVTGKAKSIKINRGGRVSGVVDEMDAGTLTAIISDPYVDPAQNDRMRAGRKVRVTALDSTATWRALFTGRIDQIDVDYVDKADPSANPEVTITAVDAIAEMRNVQQPFNYAGAYGPKVKALMAADTNITYVADAGTASTDINHRDRDNGRLWDQLVLARNSFAGAQLWIDQDGTLQAVTVTPSGTPAYGFSDEAVITLTNLESNPSFESSATIDYYLNGGTGPISFTQSSAWSVDGTYSCLVSKDDTTASFFYLGYPASPWAASYGDWCAYTITVKAVIDCRVRLARDQYKSGGLSLGVLETANLTAGDVHTFTGTTQLLYDAAMTGVKIYLDVEQPGGGAFTVSGDIIYVDQMAVYNTGSTELVSVPYYATTGTYPPMTPYTGVEVKFGNGVLVNELSVTLNNDGETDGAKEYGPYRNAASQADWGVQSATVQAIDGTAPSTLAAAFLALYATPTIFPRGVTFRWKDAYGDAVFVDLYDEVQIRHAPSNTDQVVTVLGVEHTITPKRWDVTLTLRPQGSESITVTNPAAGADTGPDDVAGAPPSSILAEVVPAFTVSDAVSGVDQSGVSVSSTAIQARIDAARDNAYGVARVQVAAGTYNLGTTGLIVHKGVDFVCDDQAYFIYSGTGAAILVDNWSELNTGRPGDGTGYVRIGRLRRASLDWDSGSDTSSIGVKLLNVNWSRIDVVECMNFWTGVQLVGDAYGTTYNNLYLGRITNNKINVGDACVNGGWANGNHFYGGAIRHTSGLASYAGTRCVNFPSANGCTFTAVNMEGDYTEETVYANSTDNLFVGCRFELANKIHFGSGSYNNQIIGGYGIWGPNQIDTSSAHITYDAAITAAGTTLTSATATWSSGDVGKSISVAGAGALISTFGVYAPLHTTIAAFTNSTTVTLTDAATTTVTAARQVTRRTAPLYPEIIDDPGRNIVWGARGQVSYAGTSYSADSAYTGWAINSNNSLVFRGRGINGNTYAEILGNGRAGFIGGSGRPDGSTTVYPYLRCDPTTSSPLGRAAFTAGRGTADPDVAFGRTSGNQPAWEANAPIVRKVVTATQASAGTTTFTMYQGDVFVLTLNANNTGLTLNLPPRAGQVIILEVVQGGSGGFTWTAPTNAKFAGGSKGTTATTAGHRDIYTFRYDGTNWLETSRSMDVG